MIWLFKAMTHGFNPRVTLCISIHHKAFITTRLWLACGNPFMISGKEQEEQKNVKVTAPLL